MRCDFAGVAGTSVSMGLVIVAVEQEIRKLGRLVPERESRPLDSGPDKWHFAVCRGESLMQGLVALR